MTSIEPHFPALLVHERGSISGFYNLSCWTDDVDQWFWSDAGDFLIDSRGWRFDQVGARAGDGRPAIPPAWAFTRELDEPYIQQLVAEEARSIGMSPPVPDDLAISTRAERVANLVRIAAENSWE